MISFQMRHSMHVRSLALVCLTVTGHALGGAKAIFQPLGFLHPDGAGPVIAYGISGDGHVVVGESNSTTGFQAFRWTQTDGIVGLGAFPNPGGLPSSTARACSIDGSVIVGASMLPDSLDEQGSPFRWTQATGLVFLGSLGGSSGGVARGVSSDGSVVVGYGSNPAFNVEAFRWTSGSGIVGLGDLPGGAFNSQASAVAGDGSIVVGPASTAAFPYNTSFQWGLDDGMTGLAPSSIHVIGMSRNGQFTVGGNLGKAVRLDLASGALTVLPHVTIPGLSTDTDIAWAANADGSVVVGQENLSQGLGFFGRAFVWDAKHGTRIIRDLLIQEFDLGAELAGWELNTATTVSDDGLSIAGYGFAPSGEQAAWFVKLPGDCPADLDGSGAINGLDLAMLLGQWTGSTFYLPCPPAQAADLNGDCKVNGLDLALLLGAWGACS